MGGRDAQVANGQGFAKIIKNPRFFLDDPRLYAKIVRVTTEHIEPDGGGAKAGFPGGKLELRNPDFCFLPAPKAQLTYVILISQISAFPVPLNST
jgi:hypothetical protein